MTIDTNGLTAGTDYTLSVTPSNGPVSIDNNGVITISDNVGSNDARKYTVTATGMGDYEGSVTGDFTLGVTDSWGVITGMTPADDAIIGDSNPVLSWTAVPKASGYQVKYKKNSQAEQTVSTTLPTFTLPQADSLASGDTLVWNVIAKDQSGSLGFSRSDFTLTRGTITGTPPVYNATVGEGKPVLSWNPEPNASGYEVTYKKNSQDAKTVSTTLPTFTLPETDALKVVGDTLDLTVRAKNQTGYGTLNLKFYLTRS